jgi:hypothetical protein
MQYCYDVFAGMGQPHIFKLNGVRARHEMKEAAN